ncbi:G protein alpha-subunit [Cystobasidium minutum MCA 4210]|uniref:G protein alpha-subunit n=1 Tax=Cystobasidium minutum MCA 4210 TaxID=1397322 RepID=UPI0034CE1910|eukprot:jgi/Rhomi1/182948/fgenesh1_pm.2_\
MGCGQSTPMDDAAKQRSEMIEKELKKTEKETRQDVKILFLGAGESTVLKQFRLLYDKPMEREERLGYREVILANTFQSLSVVLDAMQMMGIAFEHEKSPQEALIISDLGSFPEVRWPVAPHLAKTVTHLYSDGGVRKAMARRNEYQLNDSAEYFFEHVERTTNPHFVPNDDDILRCRVKTTGISETFLQVDHLRYRLLDVGGQRTERKKWLNCFEGVTVLLFLVAIQEFDQNLYEDESVSRMQEAVMLFDSVSNSRYFSETSIILFLNKIDLFKAKLRSGVLLKDHCPDYDGPDDYESGCQFMAQKFKALYRRNNELYTHFTCATDTKQVRVVLASVNDTILKRNLQFS